MIRITIFASGSGSNAENIVNYFENNNNVQIVSILSNKRDAFVFERAKRLNIPAYFFSKEDFYNTDRVVKYLAKDNIDFIILAGFLLRIPQNIIDLYPKKIINIHPALLPKYGGKGMYGDYVHKAVVAAKEKESGITIHYVNENYDEGTIIFQEKCVVEDSDSFEDVANKVHALEYKCFPIVIEKLIGDQML